MPKVRSTRAKTDTSCLEMKHPIRASGAGDVLDRPVPAADRLNRYNQEWGDLSESAIPSVDGWLTKTIMIVDDNPVSRELIRDALEGRAYHVVEAVNGVEALARIQDTSPDLVLMDIQMPIMDGYSALQEIRNDPSHSRLPVVAMTAYAMLGDREKAISAGFDGYLAKPINVTTLRMQIEQLLR